MHVRTYVRSTYINMYIHICISYVIMYGHCMCISMDVFFFFFPESGTALGRAGRKRVKSEKKVAPVAAAGAPAVQA